MAPIVIDSLVGTRIGAVLIDVIPSIIIHFIFIWIPIIGWFFGGVINAAYWLLRDIKGASLGKHLLGLKVVMKDGSESTTNARIMRNVTLAVGPILGAIPIAGLFIAPPIAFCVGVLELVFIFTRHERLGDQIAGTAVVRR